MVYSVTGASELREGVQRFRVMLKPYGSAKRPAGRLGSALLPVLVGSLARVKVVGKNGLRQSGAHVCFPSDTKKPASWPVSSPQLPVNLIAAFGVEL